MQRLRDYAFHSWMRWLVLLCALLQTIAPLLHAHLNASPVHPTVNVHMHVDSSYHVYAHSDSARQLDATSQSLVTDPLLLTRFVSLHTASPVTNQKQDSLSVGQKEAFTAPSHSVHALQAVHGADDVIEMEKAWVRDAVFPDWSLFVCVLFCLLWRFASASHRPVSDFSPQRVFFSGRTSPLNPRAPPYF